MLFNKILTRGLELWIGRSMASRSSSFPGKPRSQSVAL
jgi:hypothetical protein